MSGTILVVSPHLDDAAFSIGGGIARRVDEGWRVVIATVFTASVRDPTGFALACQLDKGLSADVDYMALRRREDETACAILGAEPLWLPLAEAPHRGYHSAPSLFSPMRADDGIVPQILANLRRLIDMLAPAELWGPQAIGAHVDHVAVLEALLLLDRRLTLWTDHPYAMRDEPRGSPLADRLDGATTHHMTLTADELDRKVRASIVYASQVGFQFGGAEAARAALIARAATETVLIL